MLLISVSTGDFQRGGTELEEGAEYFNLTADRNGRLWLGSLGSLHLLRLNSPPDESPVEREVKIIEPAYDGYIINVLPLSNGIFLMTTDRRAREPHENDLEPKRFIERG